MPKVSTASSHSSGSVGPFTGTGGHPNVLKRNQACHQCRRRKLKCDANRPCSTCVRSHAHAVSHAPAGTHVPAHPECTFDDVAETAPVVAEVPKNRYERLENRINELEALLQKQDQPSQKPSYIYSDNRNGKHEFDFSTYGSGDVPNAPSFQFVHSLNNRSDTRSPGVNVSTSPPQGAYITTTTPTPPLEVKANGPISANYGMDISWPNWPINLPPPNLLRHLVEVFFAFHPNANQLFHVATFMPTLSLPPNHPKFPIVPLLHAICAMGSLYTAAVSSPPLPNLNEEDPHALFNQKYRAREADSFSEQQARFAKYTADDYQNAGEGLLQCLQARIILSWYYWCHSKWVEVFVAAGQSLRVSVPLGLNVCPPFHSISQALRAPSILPPARTVIEDETRRNVFWLAYALERQHGGANGWALSLDDQDISQLLPVRADQFEQGILVTPHERQWAHSKDLLLVHPEGQTDSFILYIKGSILMSKVKNFNLRFRARYYSGDTSVTSTSSLNGTNEPKLVDSVAPVDPRTTPAFIELDHLVSSFRASFPSHLKNPVVDNVVDSHLYTTCLIPHVATILLHEPHADVRASGCISALKILTASRAILDLIYAVWSTSFDITLLDSFCIFCWFMGGRILVRFLQAAVEANSQDQVSTLRTELEFFRSAISKVGERIPLAYRYAKMLNDLAVRSCGSVTVVPDPPSPTMSPPKPPTPTESFLFDVAQSSISAAYLKELFESQPQSQTQPA